ncbi:mechanosensitive ion channel family protein [Oceanidesulfovibrio marinus]|uniref:Mechanosensitive ion channel family protein n=1 Tax=Oceanidesulfovibrio marinus TaxID=370038 RepID=A0ABX6NIT8_9BACT|nr:mechanosensitive ion channel family protein [Oceanidesulfovibrio marinus]QJT10498.1 mechanosensitive ion channel family protein [Oceanidesulfovibrio marinus]
MQESPFEPSFVWEQIDKTLRSIWTDFLNYLPFIIAGVVVLLVVVLFERIAIRVLHRSLSTSKLRGSLKQLIERMVSISLWGLGLLLTAMVVFPGLTPTRALGALGVVSIAVGFAFRDIFENFFAGFLILWQFPFEQGDYIECQGITGKVVDVTVRMTIIRTMDDELIIMPNATIFKNPLNVLTYERTRRVKLMTGIAYGEDVATAVQVIKDALKKCRTIDAAKPVQVFPHGFGSSSIDIEVTWWTGSKPLDVRRSRGEVVTAVKSALDQAGIEIPFPYRTLTFKHPLQVVQDEGAQGEEVQDEKMPDRE